MDGYIKLYRSLLDNCVFDDAEALKVWIWCLLSAYFSPSTYLNGLQVIELKPGQFIYGRKKAAKDLKMNDSTFYRKMKLLQNLKKVNIKANNKFTLVTVVNWELYQGDTFESEQQMNIERTSNEHQMNTKEERKERKERKEYYNPLLSPLKRGQKKKRGFSSQYSDEALEEIEKRALSE